MKTKVLLMMAACSLLVYSCSDRDEQLNENPAENAKIEKLELKKLKPINKDSGSTNKVESDTIKILPPASITPSNGLDPDPSLDPNPDPNDPELIPPGDIRPPKGGK